MINPLTQEELHNLSVDELASRMDTILLESEIEIYGPEVVAHKQRFSHKPSVSKILSTTDVQAMEVGQQRAICHLAFNTLLQMEYTMFTCAASNHYVYGPNLDEEKRWGFPTIQIRNAALNQFGIISSRISMEAFMELLHYLGTGERIKSKKSTFKSFKKWLNNPKNPFSYFATHILRAFVFDRNHRTPEVHASSKLSSKVLMMGKPSKDDQNTCLGLANVMLNIWQPLIEILNDRKCYSMHGSEEDFEWLKSYLHDTEEEKGSFLESIFEQMK